MMLFMRSYILLLILISLYPGEDEVRQPERRFFRSPSFEADSLRIHPERVEFKDTIVGDMLLVYENKEGLVHSYSREINTGVCIDGACRRLSMTLYWTVTGRYFGFVLPKGEFLSKTEHVPFREEDYHRLEEILANPYSVLGQYRIEELVSGPEEGVDGVTAATLAAVKQEVVPDAVYTTFTLWHLIYGETPKRIRQYTRERLTDQLAVKLLESPDFEDKRWTLENMGPQLRWNDELRQVVLDKILHGQDILAAQALSAFPDSILAENSVQTTLAEGFSGMAYANQRKVLEKLSHVSVLDPQAALLLAGTLTGLRADLVDDVFQLFEVHHVQNEAIDRMVVLLLNLENRFIARRAAEYLETSDIKDKKVRRQIKKIRLNGS